MDEEITSSCYPVPTEIDGGHLIRWNDMTTTQEEADRIIVQQLSGVRGRAALVVADDTDIFVLLLHFIWNGSITCPVMMASPIRNRTMTDINATATKHDTIMPNLIATHGLTGCDTVATYFGIGKGVALKVLRSGHYPLNLLGIPPKICHWSSVKQNDSFWHAMAKPIFSQWLRHVSGFGLTKVGKVWLVLQNQSHSHRHLSHSNRMSCEPICR